MNEKQRGLLTKKKAGIDFSYKSVYEQPQI